MQGVIACDHCSGTFGLFARHKYHKQYKIPKQIERKTTRGIFCDENDLISDRSKVYEYCKYRTGF